MADTTTTAEIVVLEQAPTDVLLVTIAERGAAGTTDHGEQTGLDDDDHGLYHTDARGDARYAPIAHASDTANPHGVTAAQAGAEAAGTAATLIAAHSIDSDPHAGYALEADLGTAAHLDVGTAVGDVVQVQTGGKLPALDGSLLTGLAPGGVTDYGDLTGLPTLGTAAATAATDYAPASKGVTNGDTHDHSGGDGAQIAYSSLSGLPSLGTAAAAATGDFEAAGAVSTHAGLAAPHSGHSTPAAVSAAISSHNATSGVHGITAFAATVLDDADAATARATLGVPGGSGTSTGTNTGDSATPAETETTIGTLINGAASKTTPVDADKVSIWDSVTGLLQAVTWANIKTTLAGAFAQLSGATFTGVVNVASAKNITITQAANELIVVPPFDAATTLATFPGPKIIWHDRLAFSRGYGVPVFETYNGSWSAGTLDAGLFSQQENRAQQQIDGVTQTACRWTWNSANVAYSFAQWWFVGVTYVSPTSTKNITIETSPDGLAWTTRHTTTGDINNSTCLALSVGSWTSETYIRLTITVTDGQPLKLSTIRALTSRWGNQGGGSEQEYPYIWGSDGKVAFGTENSNDAIASVNSYSQTGEAARIGYSVSTCEKTQTSSAGATTKTLIGSAPSIKWIVSDTTTNAIYDVATFSKNTGGAGAAGLGVRINLAAKSSTTSDTVFGAISASIVEATHATRKGKVRLFGADSTGLREGFCAEADGTQIKTSVNGVTPVARAAALTAEIPGDATRDELRLTELYNACKAFGIIN